MYIRLFAKSSAHNKGITRPMVRIRNVLKVGIKADGSPKTSLKILFSCTLYELLIKMPL